MPKVKLIIKGVDFYKNSIKVLLDKHKKLPSVDFVPGKEKSLDKAETLLYTLTKFDKSFAPVAFLKLKEDNDIFDVFYESIVPVDTEIIDHEFVDLIEAYNKCSDL